MPASHNRASAADRRLLDRILDQPPLAADTFDRMAKRRYPPGIEPPGLQRAASAEGALEMRHRSNWENAGRHVEDSASPPHPNAVPGLIGTSSSMTLMSCCCHASICAHALVMSRDEAIDPRARYRVARLQIGEHFLGDRPLGQWRRPAKTLLPPNDDRRSSAVRATLSR